MKKKLLLFLLALVILAPKIGYIDYPVLILFSMSIYFFSDKLKIQRRKIFNIIMISWLFLISWGLITFIYNGSVNEILLLKPIRQILILLFVTIIVSKTNLLFSDVCNTIIIAALLNTLVICLQLYGHNGLGNPDFLMPMSFDSELNVPFRKPGVFAGYPHSGLLSLFAIVCIVDKVKTIKTKYFVTLFLVLFFSLIVTSRTGLILSFVPISWLFLKSLSSKKILLKSIIVINLNVFGLIAVLSTLPADTFDVAFEGFINYRESGSFSTSSQQALNSSYIIPQKVSTYIFGNGLSNRTDADTNIDDGYQSLLYGGGVIYFIISLLLFLIYYLFTIKHERLKDNRLIISILYIIILIANYKVDCLFSRVISEIFSLFLAVSLFSRKDNFSDNESRILYSTK